MNIADLEVKKKSGDVAEPSDSVPLIFDYISNNNWDSVQALCESNPKVAAVIDPVSGQTPLHVVCSIGSATPAVIAAVVAAAPENTKVVDKVYGDTPLHIACRNSQKTASKVEILLEHCSPEDILRRNVIGGTCLHSACGHNAVFAVFQLLIHKNPAVLKVSTFDAIPPIRGLFFSYTQSIPGVLAIGKLLKGVTLTNAGHFERFWAKASFLAVEYFKLTNAYCASDMTPLSSKYVAHGLIHSNAPLNLLKVALTRDPGCAEVVDRNGNTPLHLLVERRPYRLKELDAIRCTLKAFPQAAGVANHDGSPPLILAIRNKIPYENAIGDILRADMTVVSRRDAETELFPFQLAASVGGPEALNTTFQLLTALPQQIGF